MNLQRQSRSTTLTGQSDFGGFFPEYEMVVVFGTLKAPTCRPLFSSARLKFYRYLAPPGGAPENARELLGGHFASPQRYSNSATPRG